MLPYVPTAELQDQGHNASKSAASNLESLDWSRQSE